MNSPTNLAIRLCAFLAAICPCAFPTGMRAQAPATAPANAAVWKGRIETGATNLDFVLRIRRVGAEYQATLDIPAQGAAGLALKNVVVDEKKLECLLPAGAPAQFKLTISKDGKAAAGSMNQIGQNFPVTANLITEAEAADVGPRRPQTPKPPFPYKQEQVTFKNKSDDVTLAGTLTRPDRPGPHPVAILISGSGPQDRDETIFSHKPFLVIADHLTRKGIAVLRYDDRGVGESEAEPPVLLESTTASFADDARAAVRFLRTRDDIDPDRVALIGHSEGGVIAPMIAAGDERIAGIVMLAGTGVPGRKVLAGQLERINLASGIARENIDRQLDAQARWMDLFISDGPKDQIRAALKDLVTAQLQTRGPNPAPAQIEAAVDQAMAAEGSDWMRFFIKYDPAEALRRVKCPVLVMAGGRDLQVIPKDNLPAIKKALEQGDNHFVTGKQFPHLNHLFQTCVSGAPAEYAMIEETFAPEALNTLTDWLMKKLKVTKPSD